MNEKKVGKGKGMKKKEMLSEWTKFFVLFVFTQKKSIESWCGCVCVCVCLGL